MPEETKQIRRSQPFDPSPLFSPQYVEPLHAATGEERERGGQEAEGSDEMGDERRAEERKFPGKVYPVLAGCHRICT